MKRKGIINPEITEAHSSSSIPHGARENDDEITLADWVKAVEEHLNMNFVRMRDAEVFVRLSESQDASSDSENYYDTTVTIPNLFNYETFICNC